MVDIAANFGGSIPEFYDRFMGAAQFETFQYHAQALVVEARAI